jgi:hypothetical protein
LIRPWIGTQKITFGEMRDMGVRGTPAPDLVKKQTTHSSPPPFRAPRD